MPVHSKLLRSAVKNILAATLYHSGLLGWLIKRDLRGKCLALMYHRIMPTQDRDRSFSHPAIIVDPDRFTRHLALLSRYFDIISLDKIDSILLSHSPDQRPAILITFDDAWSDNYHYAFPILRSKKLPATIFVPVEYIETGKLFWQEELGHLLNAACDNINTDIHNLLNQYRWDHLSAFQGTERSHEIKKCVRDIKRLEYEEINHLLDKLRSIIGTIDFGVDRYLTKNQIIEMSSHDISFQSHACSHRILPRLDQQEINYEMRESREWLSTLSREDCMAIAYPNGDFDDRVKDAAEQHGYQYGFSTLPGSIHSGADRHALRRINIHDDSSSSDARFLMAIYLASRNTASRPQ